MNSPATSEPELLERQIWQLMKVGKLDEAAAACDHLNQAFPDYGPGWNTSSRLAIAMNEPIIALRAVQQALLLSPGKPEWLLQKMASLAVYGDLKAANVLADELAGHDFETAYHSSTCAVTLNRLGRYADAARHLEKAVYLNPNNPNYHFSLATAQRHLGEDAAASISLDRAIELDPGNGEAQLLRSGFKQQTEADNNIESLRAGLTQLPDPHPARAQLGYALAKELDDLGRYTESFIELERAAATRRARLQYRLQDDIDAMRAIAARFDGEFFAVEREGFVNAEPIFVIGMPRAGTALVENVLNEHSVVRAVGEPQMFAVELVNQCQQVLGTAPEDSQALIQAAAEVDFAALGEAYHRSARPKTASHAHFVDRLPLNFMYAGLIHCALPKAKIILVERDPMDNCYAAFKTIFPGAYPYSYDLEELASYFVAYRTLITHWQAVLPGVIHRVQYEQLVREPRPVIEDLLEYCSLSFEEPCLSYFQSGKAGEPMTARERRHQARVRGIGHWEHYREQLRPLQTILESAGIAL